MRLRISSTAFMFEMVETTIYIPEAGLCSLPDLRSSANLVQKEITTWHRMYALTELTYEFQIDREYKKDAEKPKSAKSTPDDPPLAFTATDPQYEVYRVAWTWDGTLWADARKEANHANISRWYTEVARPEAERRINTKINEGNEANEANEKRRKEWHKTVHPKGECPPARVYTHPFDGQLRRKRLQKQDVEPEPMKGSWQVQWLN